MKWLALISGWLALTAAASAQEGVDFFPAERGDRWVYDVQGSVQHDDPSLPTPGVVDLEATWTVVDVRSSSDVDSVFIEVQRKFAEGGGDTTLCRIIRPRAGIPTYIGGGSAPPRDRTEDMACFAAGGFPFPFHDYNTVFGGREQGSVTVLIGTEELTREARSWGFSEYYSSNGSRSAKVYRDIVTSLTMMDGVGPVEVEDRFRLDVGPCWFNPDGPGMSCTTMHRDTIRVRLVGADVGGVAYGDLGPTATAPPPPRATIAVGVAPNPAAGALTLHVSTPASGVGRADVFDVVGRRLRSVDFGSVLAGEFVKAVDLGGVPPGTYLIRVTVGDAVGQARAVVVR